MNLIEYIIVSLSKDFPPIYFIAFKIGYKYFKGDIDE